ncbi:MAG: hypothetical protein GX117_06050 [Candidatus Hydrogenedentes bacterium]|nr:hypothetical protein [Candidatus Hydrogenedentota bacterium]
MSALSKNIQRTIIIAFIIGTLAIGAVLNLHLRHLRQSEAFYRWILAFAVNDRLFQEDRAVAADFDLFYQCAEVVDTLPEMTGLIPPKDESNTAPISALSVIASDYTHDKELWNFARSKEAAPLREEFLSLVRERKLRFAQDIQYAEAQAGGVNLFNFFFGFRKVAANFVWLEVDRYWHQGNTYRMITLMRTCVALDPQFIDAYLIGAWHLAYNATARMPDTPWPLREWHAKYEKCLGEKERFYYVAVDFLKDGIRKNSRNSKLYFDLGFSIYKQKLKDYPNAVKYLAEAVHFPHEQYVPRQLFLCLELNGQYEESLVGWKDYAARYPDNPVVQEVAPRFIARNEGFILEKLASNLRKKAREAGDQEEAERLNNEASDLWEQARAVWSSINDPFGEGRKMRMEALDMREEGRHLEAVAYLDKARWEASDLFDDFSNLIIEIKQEAGIPLTISEKKAVIRESEAGICAGMPEDEIEKRSQAAQELDAAN